jgi:imidazolonepropionase
MIVADFLIEDADLVATCAGPGPRAARPRPHRRHPARSVASLDGRIVFVGRAQDCRHDVSLRPDATVLDARGKTPSSRASWTPTRTWCSPVTGATSCSAASPAPPTPTSPLPAAASSRPWRRPARPARRAGGGGAPRLAAMLAHGTTTAEVKSGYGLDLDTELRLLRAIRRLGSRTAHRLSATFMGAHEFPSSIGRGAPTTSSLVADEMVPAVAAEGLAEWCDVFCEQGVFTPEESTRILEAGLAHGLKPRIHADELALSRRLGGGRRGRRPLGRPPDLRRRAARRRMAEAGVVATLLPAAAFFLKLGRFAPARMLIERGVPVALATDLNPGGGFTPSMPFVMALACFGMNMTLEEALVAPRSTPPRRSTGRTNAAASKRARPWTPCSSTAPLSELVRVGAPVIAAVVKNGTRLVA